MRSAQKSNRARGRGGRKSNGNIANRVFDSSGPEGKVRGTPQQIIDKYLTLARDSQTAGDRVMSENFLQHAEHYQRLLIQANAAQNERRDGNGADHDQDGDGHDGQDAGEGDGFRHGGDGRGQRNGGHRPNGSAHGDGDRRHAGNGADDGDQDDDRDGDRDGARDGDRDQNRDQNRGREAGRGSDGRRERASDGGSARAPGGMATIDTGDGEDDTLLVSVSEAGGDLSNEPAPERPKRGRRRKPAAEQENGSDAGGTGGSEDQPGESV